MLLSQFQDGLHVGNPPSHMNGNDRFGARRDLGCDIAGIEAERIRLNIDSSFENQGINPAWHPAPGATCWLFLDEVLVE